MSFDPTRTCESSRECKGLQVRAYQLGRQDGLVEAGEAGRCQKQNGFYRCGLPAGHATATHRPWCDDHRTWAAACLCKLTAEEREALDRARAAGVVFGFAE